MRNTRNTSIPVTVKLGLAGVALFMFLFLLSMATTGVMQQFYLQCAMWAGFYVVMCCVGVILEALMRGGK